MKYFITFILLFAGSLQAKELVVVSVAPYVEFVQELTDNQVDVDLFVPAGQSSHSFEPTAKQILRAGKAKVWFTIGESFEAKAIKAIKAVNKSLDVVDLRKGLTLESDCCHGHGHDHDHDHDSGMDPHIWMSPKMMQVQLSTMAESLKAAFTDLSDVIDKKKIELEKKLSELDEKIHTLLAKKKGHVIFVSHPAYGYFCREYDLEQVSIEFEGRDPTPKQLTRLLKLAKTDNIHYIFVQEQYSPKAATLIANEVGAKTVMLNPYSEQYFASMLQIATAFSEDI